MPLDEWECVKYILPWAHYDYTLPARYRIAELGVASAFSAAILLGE